MTRSAGVTDAAEADEGAGPPGDQGLLAKVAERRAHAVMRDMRWSVKEGRRPRVPRPQLRRRSGAVDRHIARLDRYEDEVAGTPREMIERLRHRRRSTASTTSRSDLRSLEGI